MKKLFIYLLLVLLSLSLVSAIPTTVEQDGYIITSDKETFSCTNIFNGNGDCLIKSHLTVENTNAQLKEIELLFVTDIDVTVRTQEIKTVGQSGRVKRLFNNKGRGNNFISEDTHTLSGNSILEIELQFWTNEDGKFDYGIKYDGIEFLLDPFFNSSSNTSSPTYHLIDGIVDIDADPVFTQTNIINELSDNDDNTFFSIFDNTVNGSSEVLFVDHDGVGDSNTADMNNIEEGAFNDLNITELNNIQNVEVCFLSQTVGGNPTTNISIAYNTTHAPIILNGFPSPVIQDTWNCENVSSEHLPLFDRLNLFVGTVCPLCDGTDKFKIVRDDDGLPISYWSGSAWSFDTGRSLMINTTITYGSLDNPDGNSLSLFFNHTINVSYSYWLRTRKTSTGTANTTVYAYINDTDLNTSSFTSSLITTGWDVIPISSILTDGITPRFRLFTNNDQNISEVQLIEQLDDVITPTITDCIVNNTELGCSETVRLSCNVTDNVEVDDVNLNYTDLSNHYVLADKVPDTDIYFVDVLYNHDTNGLNETYNFYMADAIDIVGLTDEILVDTDYVYNCKFPDVTNPVIEISLNPSVDKILFNLTTQANCTDNENLSSFNMVVYNSTDTIFDSTNISTILETRLQIHDFLDLTPIATGNYNRNTTCTDYENNIELIQDVVSVIDTSPPIITLLNPDNLSVIEFIDLPDQTSEVTFKWETNQNAECIFNEDLFTSPLLPSATTHEFIYVVPLNQTINWYVNCTSTFGGLSSQSVTRTVTIEHLPDPSFFVRSVCPASTLSGSIFFIFLIMLGLGIWFMGMTTGTPVLGILGGFGTIMLSVYIFACMTMFGTIFLLTGVFMVGQSIVMTMKL